MHAAGRHVIEQLRVVSGHADLDDRLGRVVRGSGGDLERPRGERALSEEV